MMQSADMTYRAAMAASTAALLILTGAPGRANAAEFDCLIEPAQVVEVRSPVVGILQQVHARRGEFIARGAVLVTIESSVEKSAADAARFRSEAQGALLLARSKVAAGREKARRMNELLAEEFVSQQARDDAVAELKLAEAEQRSAEENVELARLEHRQSVDQLNRRVLRSPFNGVVVDRMLNPGDLAESGTGRKPILKLAQVEPLRVEVVLPIAAYGKIKPGASAQVMPESIGGRHPAKVTIVFTKMAVASPA